MYAVDWVSRNRKNFLEFSRVLKECKNPRIYQTDFIHALVDEFWKTNQDKLKQKFFYPWLTYMVCSFYYFESVASDGLLDDNDQWNDRLFKASITTLTLSLFIYQLLIESQ